MTAGQKYSVCIVKAVKRPREGVSGESESTGKRERKGGRAGGREGVIVREGGGGMMLDPGPCTPRATLLRQAKLYRAAVMRPTLSLSIW